MPKTNSQPAHNFLKIYLFCLAVGLISNFLFWYTFGQIIQNPYSTLTQLNNPLLTFSILALSLLVFLSIVILILILIRDTRPRWILLIGINSGVLILMYIHIAFTVLTFLVLALLFLLLDQLSQRDLKSHLQPLIFHIFSHRIGLVILIIALIAGVGSYLTALQNLTHFNFQLSPNLIESSFDYLQPLLNQTVEQQQQNFLQLAVQQIDQEFPALSQAAIEDKQKLIQGEITPTMREILSNQGLSNTQIDQIAQELSIGYQENISQFQKNLNQNLIREAQTEVLNGLNNLISQYKDLAPWVISILVFLTISSFNILYRLAAVGLGILLLKLFSRLGWVEKTTSSVQATAYTIAQ